MEFTQEEQRLLKGDCLIRTENGEFQVTNAGMGDATTAPDYMKRRIIEIRTAMLQGRGIPAPSPEYVRGAEERAARARILGRACLDRFGVNQTDAENHRRLTELDAQIKRDALDLMSTAELRAELDRRMAGMDTLPCPAQTLTATRQDHLQAAQMHTAFASKAADLGRKDEALRHYAAAQEHQNAASVLDDDDEGDADDRSLVLSRCMQSCRDSFAFGAGMTSAPDFGGWQK